MSTHHHANIVDGAVVGSQCVSAHTQAVRDFPAWGEREIARFKFRAALFQRRGLAEPRAEVLADRLYERDYERDDRRVCYECSEFQRSGTCHAAALGQMAPGTPKRYEPVPDLLQRCEGFNWTTP